jgi:hypothetical protein
MFAKHTQFDAWYVREDWFLLSIEGGSKFYKHLEI